MREQNLVILLMSFATIVTALVHCHEREENEEKMKNLCEECQQKIRKEMEK